ncbi:helix-turn-helix domain-containing protein [Alsobacter sp. SYSU BS001988]
MTIKPPSPGDRPSTRAATELGDLARLLTVEDAAAMLRVDPRTIRRRIKSGELSAIYIGRLVRIDADALRVFVSNCGR